MKTKIRFNQPDFSCLHCRYNAGAWRPLHVPFGWRMQFPAVIEEIELKVCPQYLQVYLLFSLPS